MTNFREHELTPYCWCKPKVVVDAENHMGIYHHHRTLTRDTELRAAGKLIDGGTPV